MRIPYASVDEITSYPHYRQLGRLNRGTSTQNDAELLNMLLRATAAIVGFCSQPLGAEVVTERRIVRVRPDGMLKLHPRRFPWDPDSLTAVSFKVGSVSVDLDLTGMLVDEAAWEIPVTFPCVGRGQITYTYTSGWANTTLAADAAEAATDVTVTDAAGLKPGLTLRLLDAGDESWVTVADTYTVGSTTVPLAAPLDDDHDAGVVLSALPDDIHQSCILWTLGLLTRSSSTATDDSFADAPASPTAKDKQPNVRRTGTGLIKEARQILVDGGYRRPV